MNGKWKNGIIFILGWLRELNEKMHLKCLAWDLPQKVSAELLRPTVFALVTVLASECLMLSFGKEMTLGP